MDNETKNKVDFSNKIEERIAGDKIKIRSKWFFIFEKLGLESGLLFSIILAVILISLALYIMQENGTFEFLEFGVPGWKIILGNIPFELIIIALMFFLVSNYIIKQFDFSYKKPFYLFSCGVLVIIGVIGSVLFLTGISHALYQNGVAKVSDYYKNKITNTPQGEQALIGRLVNYNNDYINVLTPQGKIIKVKIIPEQKIVFDKNLPENIIVKIIGQRQGNVFSAQFIRITSAPGNRYFRIIPKPVPIPPPPVRNN